MSENYIVKQNVSNNLYNSNYFLSQEKKSFRRSQNTCNSVGSKIIENTDETYGIDEIPPKEEDVDHLKIFHLGKVNRKNSLNFKKIPTLSFINPFQNFKRTVSGNITHPHKEEDLIPIERNRVKTGLFRQKKTSEEKQPPKRMQSNYNFVSENKYNFAHRLSDNHKFVTKNKSSKSNYVPIDYSTRDSKSQDNKKLMSNSGQKILRNSNYHTVNELISNPSFMNFGISDKSGEKIFDKRENRFLNNKTTSNRDYNTKYENNLQNHIQSVKLDKNNHNINQNIKKLNSHSSIQNNVIDYATVKNGINKINNQNVQKYNNNYIGSKRLTVGYKYIDEPKYIKNNNQTYHQNKSKSIQTYSKEKEQEFQVAIVTKITSSENNNLVSDFGTQNIIPMGIFEGNKSQIINKDANNYLTEEEINRIFNQSSVPLKNQKSNSYLYSSMVPKKTNLKLSNNYSMLNDENYNIENINAFFNQPQDIQNANYVSYNEPFSQRATVINSKINNNIININKPLINNNAELFYNINNYNKSKGFVKNYDVVSRPGKDSSGLTKTNQDSFVCKSKINNINNFNIFGVLDGHGPDGHFVSEFISEFIPSQIINHKDIINLTSTEAIYRKLKENSCKIITQAFISADKQLQNMEFDVSESGCTCCLIIHIGKHIICANTGDSRAILVYDQTNGINSKNLDCLGIVPLSIDYKPELPEEASRIILAGGEVEQMKDEFGEGSGPYRVWVRGKDYPGLAMSRSIGDLRGKTVGVIPDPGIMEYDLNKSTKFIIVCSDGVWEFLNNETIMNIGKKHYLNNNPNSFCQEVVSTAYKTWEKNDSTVDDITAVAAFF